MSSMAIITARGGSKRIPRKNKLLSEKVNSTVNLNSTLFKIIPIYRMN